MTTPINPYLTGVSTWALHPLIGHVEPGRPGAPADLILFRARHMTEWLSRPQADRIVLRNGKVLDAEVPDWRELDHLFQ